MGLYPDVIRNCFYKLLKLKISIFSSAAPIIRIAYLFFNNENGIEIN